jgi:hypothetical protein
MDLFPKILDFLFAIYKYLAKVLNFWLADFKNLKAGLDFHLDFRFFVCFESISSLFHMK